MQPRLHLWPRRAASVARSRKRASADACTRRLLTEQPSRGVRSHVAVRASSPARRSAGGCTTLPVRVSLPSDAGPLDLEWIAPRGCPAREAVLDDVARILGPKKTEAPLARVAARAVLFRGDDA